MNAPGSDFGVAGGGQSPSVRDDGRPELNIRVNSPPPGGLAGGGGGAWPGIPEGGGGADWNSLVNSPGPEAPGCGAWGGASYCRMNSLAPDGEGGGAAGGGDGGAAGIDCVGCADMGCDDWNNRVNSPGPCPAGGGGPAAGTGGGGGAAGTGGGGGGAYGRGGAAGIA